MQTTNKSVIQITPKEGKKESEGLIWNDANMAHHLGIEALEASSDTPCRVYFEKRNCKDKNLQIVPMGSVRLTAYSPNYTLKMYGYTVNAGWNIFARVEFADPEKAKPVEIGIVGRV
jgi:hypothetical protein